MFTEGLSGRVLDVSTKGRRFETHCVGSLSKTLYPLLRPDSIQELAHMTKDC